jgi:hypothetical protein
MGRYLTEKEKEQEMDWLYERCEGAPAEPIGGAGYMDAPFIPYLKVINSLPGICTLQSCIGHTLASDYIQPGNLWLRFEFWADRAFSLRLAELVNQPNIERVSKLYMPDGEDVREIVSIDFKGGEQFKESIEPIVGFLRSLVIGAIPESQRAASCEASAFSEVTPIAPRLI